MLFFFAFAWLHLASLFFTHVQSHTYVLLESTMFCVQCSLINALYTAVQIIKWVIKIIYYTSHSFSRNVAKIIFPILTEMKWIQPTTFQWVVFLQFFSMPIFKHSANRCHSKTKIAEKFHCTWKTVCGCEKKWNK